MGHRSHLQSIKFANNYAKMISSHKFKTNRPLMKLVYSFTIRNSKDNHIL